MDEEELKNPQRITEAMKSALARMYADQDMREYLKHAINVANQGVLLSLKANKADVARDFSIRLDALQLLLNKGKALFNQAESLRSKSLEEQLNEQKNATE